MNLRHTRTIYRKGSRVAVLDRTVRWKAAARAMRRSGRRDLHICCSLRRSREALDRVLDFGWRF
jgi:hypothetical protein